MYRIISIQTVTLRDGRRVAYHSKTPFLVQVGKGKSAYRTRYTITGNIEQALFYYHAINIGNGYKKRLVCWGLNKPVLFRAFSESY